VRLQRVCCVSAAGQYVPPLLIFKRKRMVDNLKDGAPPGTIFACQESGWINCEIFGKWLQQFMHQQITECCCYLMAMQATPKIWKPSMAHEAGVIMLSFPPHCSDRVQPFDVSFYGPTIDFFHQLITTDHNPDTELCHSFCDVEYFWTISAVIFSWNFNIPLQISNKTAVILYARFLGRFPIWTR